MYDVIRQLPMHMMKTEKIVRVQQCLHNSWKQSIYGKDVAPELLVLTIDRLLVKLRITDDGKKYEELMSVNLAKFEILC